MRHSLLKAIPDLCIFVIAVTDSRRPTLHYGSEVVATMPGNASSQVVEQTSNVVNELNCDALYAVVGQVHPRQENPRRFIDDLQRLVSRKGLQAQVYFKFEYASSEQLDLFMSACDAYVCPHLAPGGEYQISSGTIAHALSAGKPVVSVDHILGREVAAMGCGLAVMRCENAFANALREIIVNIKLRESLERNAQAAGKQMTWQHVAGRYAAILNVVD